MAAAAGQPRLVVGGLHHDDGADHPGVLRAAVFGAEEVIFASLRRLEPDRAVLPGIGIGLHAERRE